MSTADEEFYDTEKMKFVLPEADYSGEEIVEKKTDKTLWYYQWITSSVILVPLIVFAILAIASPTWIGKFAFMGWGLLIFGGCIFLMLYTAQVGLAGKFVLVTETHKQLDDFSEQRKIEQVHLVSAPEKGLDIRPYQDAYKKQIDKFVIESKTLVELEGKVALGMMDDFEKDGYVVMSPEEYQRFVSPVEEFNQELHQIQLELLALQGENEISTIVPTQESTGLLSRLTASKEQKLFNRTAKVQRNLMLVTRPTTKNSQKIMKKVEDNLDEKYEGFLRG